MSEDGTVYGIRPHMPMTAEDAERRRELMEAYLREHPIQPDEALLQWLPKDRDARRDLTRSLTVEEARERIARGEGAWFGPEPEQVGESGEKP